MLSECDSSEPLFLTGSDSKSKQHICQRLTWMCTMLACACFCLCVLLGLFFCLFDLKLVSQQLFESEIQSKDGMNSICSHSPPFLFNHLQLEHVVLQFPLKLQKATDGQFAFQVFSKEVGGEC